MPQGSGQPPAGRTAWPADQLCAQIAATNRQLQRSRQRARSARVQARQVARLLDSSSPQAAVGQAVAARLEHAAEAMAQEPVVQVRVVGVQERTGQLQQGWGWSTRSAAARADAARARERSRRAREELARFQAGAAAARERVAEVHERLHQRLAVSVAVREGGAGSPLAVGSSRSPQPGDVNS